MASRDRLEVELPPPPDHFTGQALQPARRTLRAVEAATCKHDDPHPELCPRCAAERRRSA